MGNPTQAGKSTFKSRGASRYSDRPTKHVHFNDDLNEISYFIAEQTPRELVRAMTTSDNHCPLRNHYDAQWTPLCEPVEVAIELPDIVQAIVRMTHLQWDSNAASLDGLVVVKNICYQKHVLVKYTLDNWNSDIEVEAIYEPGILGCRSREYDHFRFSLHLIHANMPHGGTLQLCICFRADGQEYWDNNGHRNYTVIFSKLVQLISSNESLRGAPSASFDNQYTTDTLASDMLSASRGVRRMSVSSNCSPTWADTFGTQTSVLDRCGEGFSPVDVSKHRAEIYSRYSLMVALRETWKRSRAPTVALPQRLQHARLATPSNPMILV